MLVNRFRRQKAALHGGEVRSMKQEDAIAFFADVIRPRAAFAADQFFLENAGFDGKLSFPDLSKAAAAVRATVQDFVFEYSDLKKLRDRDRAKVIARLQVVGVDAFRDRLTELCQQKALVGTLQTGKVN